MKQDAFVRLYATMTTKSLKKRIHVYTFKGYVAWSQYSEFYYYAKHFIKSVVNNSSVRMVLGRTIFFVQTVLFDTAQLQPVLI